MALISPKGYAVVEEVNPTQIVVRWHRDEAHRERFKSGESDQYEITNAEIFPLENGAVFAETVSEKGMTVRNLIVSHAYEYIKANGLIADCVDA